MALEDDLAARLDTLTDHAPGVGAMIVSGGEVVALSVRGTRITGRDDPVAAGDAWHIGSCTKAMTATVLARMQARGVIDLGATLGEALPDMAMPPDFAAMPLRMVLRHEAGIRRDPHWSVFARLRESRADIREQRRHIAALALAERPSGKPGYSNLGYIVLGAIIEAATGQTWEQAVTSEVFAPLGIKGAGFGAPSLPGLTGHAWEEDDRWHPKLPGPFADNPQLYGPAGRVHLPLADWAKFIAVHLGAGPPGYLHPGLLAEMHRPGKSGFAAGLRAGKMPNGTPILGHNGSNTLWLADFRFIPTEGIAVALVCNAFSPDLAALIDGFAANLLTDTQVAFQSAPDALALPAQAIAGAS